MLVSMLQSTHLFQINDAGSSTSLFYMEVSSKNGLMTNLRTLAFGNVARRVADANGKSTYVNSPLVVQVTPRGALLLEHDMTLGTYVQHASWGLQGMEVVAASVNPSQVILALNGGKLVALSIAQNNTFQVVT
jgi:DNA damage-binding protein 1